MCNQTSFEKLLDFGFSPDVMDLDYPSLETNRINPEAWAQLGMLKKRPIDNMVRCRYCDTFVPVNATETKNGIILRADCYELEDMICFQRKLLYGGLITLQYLNQPESH